MIKIENVSTAGFEPAVRGMRNPMNSWERSDSQMCKCGDGFEDCCMEVHGDCPRGDEDYFTEDVFCIGKDDFDLMQRLAKAGADHRKYLRMIVVYADITAPMYWWKEFKTYRAGKRWGDDDPDMFAIPSDYLEYDIEMNSCSTMHKLHTRDLTLEDFSCEGLARMDECGFGDGSQSPTLLFERTLQTINACRRKFLETGDKKWWVQMVKLLPSCYNQRRTVMLSYEVLANIYHARKNHKLQEWQDFCKWIETLPYTEVFTGA